MDDDQFQPHSALRCAECTARLAHDQRYCVECGARRGSHHRAIADRLAAMFEQGSGAAAGIKPSSARRERSPRTALGAVSFTMPTPRAAAAAVLAMLAFGVVVGSFGKSSLESLASAPLLLLVSQPPQVSSIPPASSAGSGGSGGSSNSSSGGSSSSTTTTTTTSSTTTSSTTSSTTTGSGSSSLLGLPPVHHVFLIVMSEQGYGQTFAPGSADTYLSTTLARQGELIEDYYAVAGSELANRIALVSGEGPTQQTAANCPVFATITPATKHSEGQVIGSGCVYPSRTDTLAGQLTVARDTWKAYIEGVDKGRKGQPTSCRHPKLGANDGTQAPSTRDPYVTWSNPFVYFSSLTKSACQKDDVGLDKLAADLKSASTAPTFAFISPDACDDGSDQPCSPKAKTGLGPADTFLKTIVPEIKKSAAYKDNGLIAITFDEAPQTGPHADPSACCSNPTYPNLPPPPTTTTTTTPGAAADPGGTTTGTTTTPVTTTTSSTTTTTPVTTTSSTTTTPATTTSTPATTTTTPATTASTTSTTTTTTSTTTTGLGTTGLTTPTGGGGQVGLLLISPYVKPNTVDDVDYYNHFSLLATVENLFGVKKLAYASDLSLPVFDAAVFNYQAP